ncbi:MAG TPA: hypothetical protein VGC04_14410 [Cellulomonas sp.]
MLNVAQVASGVPVAENAGRRQVAAVVSAVVAAAAMLVLAFRADHWVLSYDLGSGGPNPAIAPWLAASLSAVALARRRPGCPTCTPPG